MFLSVDLSSRFIHMVQMKKTGRGYAVTGFACEKTPDDTVKNGVVTNPAGLGEALRRMADQNGFKARQMCVSATSPLISYHELTVPALRQKDLEDMLTEETSQMSSTKNESLMDYVILGTDQKEEGLFCRVWCAIVPRTLVEGYSEAVQKGGFRPLCMDTAVNSACKIWQHDETAKNQTVIYAGVREDELCLSLFDAGGRRLFRGVPIASAAPQLDNEFILSSSVAAADGGSDVQKRITETAVTQISKLLQFQMMRSKDSPVTGVCLCSDWGASQQLAEDIRSTLHLQVASAAAPSFLTCPRDFSFAEYLYAVGAGIRA